MNNRIWAIIPGVAALLMVGGYLDWSFQRTVSQNNGVDQSVSTTLGDKTLRACDTSQESYVGPLVPSQNPPAFNMALNEIVPVNAIPRDSWSARAGFSISSSTSPEYWAQMLGSGWYLDWNMHGEKKSNGLIHWQMVRVHEDCVTPSPEAIQAATVADPGQVWIIGNEPDVIWQDNVTPEKYAIYYGELYQLIKSSDPSALIAVGGISQATPLRFLYLDRVLQSYQDYYHLSLPADWWTVHGYVLREEKNSWGVEIPPGIDATHGELYEVSDHNRLDLFEEQIVNFRQWMKDNGYQGTPLALTEFGILMPTSYGFPIESIADYLELTFSWLYQKQDEKTGYPEDDYHLVQKWAWFSISDPNYSSSNLGDISTGKMTLIGERFRSVVSTEGQ